MPQNNDTSPAWLPADLVTLFAAAGVVPPENHGASNHFCVTLAAAQEILNMGRIRDLQQRGNLLVTMAANGILHLLSDPEADAILDQAGVTDVATRDDLRLKMAAAGSL